MTKSVHWRFFSLCWWFFQCIKSVTHIPKLIPIHFVSSRHHQYRCSRYNKNFFFQRIILPCDYKEWGLFGLQTGLKLTFKWTVSGSKVNDRIQSINKSCGFNAWSKKWMVFLIESKQFRTLNADISKISPIWLKCQISHSVKNSHFCSEIKSWLDKRFIKLSD